MGVGFLDHLEVALPAQDLVDYQNDSIRLWLVAGDGIEVLQATRYEGPFWWPNKTLRLEMTLRATEPGDANVYLAYKHNANTAPDELAREWPNEHDQQGIKSYWVVAWSEARSAGAARRGDAWVRQVVSPRVVPRTPRHGAWHASIRYASRERAAFSASAP